MAQQKNKLFLFLLTSLIIAQSSWPAAPGAFVPPYHSIKNSNIPHQDYSLLAPLYSFLSFIEDALFDAPVPLRAPAIHSPLAIVMDLGEVAFTTDDKKMLFHLGLSLFLRAGVYNKKKFRTLLFEIMHEAKPLEKEYTTYPQPTDEIGMPLPQLMIDWMSGAIAGQEIEKTVQSYLDRNPKRVTKNKRKLIEATIHAMTSTPVFIETRKLYDNALAFAQECKACGYNLYVLSNWPATEDELKKKFPEFFNLFDGIMLSGAAGMLKPDPALYQHFLTTYALQADHTIFIDDQVINVQSAQNVGMHALVCTKKGGTPNFKAIRHAINNLFIPDAFVKKYIPAHGA